MTESSEVLPVAIALLSEHVHECIVTLMNKRPSMVERPGRCPAQCSAQRDRGAVGTAAAARLLQPLIWIQLPRSSHRISVTTEPRSRRREIETGGRICVPDLSRISPVLTLLAFDLPCWKFAPVSASCRATSEEFSGARHVAGKSVLLN